MDPASFASLVELANAQQVVKVGFRPQVLILANNQLRRLFST
jgi:hypothetical protein